MVKRDYGITNTTTRKRGRRKAYKSAKSTTLFKNLLFFTAGALLALSAAVYWITTPGITPTLSTAAKRGVKQALPPKPQERWRYIKALESKQIVIPMPAPVARAPQMGAATLSIEKRRTPLPSIPPQWRLQCESFQPTEAPQSLRANLALLGFEGTILKEGKRPRVMLGPYAHRAQADKILRQLKQDQIAHCALIDDTAH